jgi:hypothetical protein
MDYFYEMKAAGLEKPQMMENLQRWYNQNKEQAIQAEFELLLVQWSARKEAAASN